jgi:hypothetical protein
MRLEGLLLTGTNLGSLDRLSDGLEHLEKGIAIFAPARQAARRFRLGANPGVVCFSASAMLNWMSGFPDRARERAEHALAIARKLDHPFSLSYALFHTGVLHLWLSNVEIARARALELADVAGELGFQVWSAVGACLNGTTMALLGSAEEGLSLVRGGIESYRGLKTPPVFLPLLLQMEAATCALANRPHEGLALMDDPVEMSSSNYSGGFLVEFFRLKGDLLLAVSPENIGAAEPWYQHAVTTAHEAQATMLELRSAMRLSWVWQEQGRVEAARELLSEIYGKFTEGFDTADLRQARAQLDALEPAS